MRASMSKREADYQELLDARKSWLQAITDNRGHDFISRKWEVFVNLVQAAGMNMGQFERSLKGK